MSVLLTVTPEPARLTWGRWSGRALTGAALTVTVCTGAALTGLTPAHADATVTKTITIDANAILPALAFTPNGSQVYVTNANHNSVSVIDVATGTVSKTIAVGNGPASVVFTLDGSQAYVTNNNNNGSGSVSVLNVSTGTLSKTLKVGFGPVGVVFSPDGTQGYVPNRGSKSVSVLTVATGAVKMIEVGNAPTAVAFSPDGTQAYVTNATDDSVSVIDVATGTVSMMIEVGSDPTAVAFSPDGTQAYITNTNHNTEYNGSGSVSVIGVASRTVSKTIAVGTEPRTITFTPDGAQAYVPDGRHNSVSVIDVATGTVRKAITVGTGPDNVVFTPDGTQAYVSNMYNSVSVIDVATRTLIKTIRVGGGPAVVAFSPDGIQGYVSNVTDGTVSVIATGLPAHRSGSTHVTVDGPATVNPTVNAAFLITGKAPAHAAVTVHFHQAGMAAADYSIVRTVTARADGTWSRSITASQDYKYYATSASGTSATVLFQPAPTVDGPASRIVPVNQRYTLAGAAVAGSTVFLHFHKRGMAANDYSLVRSVTADAHGKWQRSYLADTDYGLYTSRTAGQDNSAGPHDLLQAG